MEARRIPADDGPERRVCSVCGFIQWGNSKATASGIVVDEAHKILLTRRAIEPFYGMWDVPGGFLEEGEHPEQGVTRELREETGLKVETVRLVGVYMDRYGPGTQAEHTLNLYYVCRIIGTQRIPVAADDALEVAWFPPQEAPSDIAFQNAREALRDFRSQEGIAANE